MLTVCSQSVNQAYHSRMLSPTTYNMPTPPNSDHGYAYMHHIDYTPLPALPKKMIPFRATATVTALPQYDSMTWCHTTAVQSPGIVGVGAIMRACLPRGDSSGTPVLSVVAR